MFVIRFQENTEHLRGRSCAAQTARLSPPMVHSLHECCFFAASATPSPHHLCTASVLIKPNLKAILFKFGDKYWSKFISNISPKVIKIYTLIPPTSFSISWATGWVNAAFWQPWCHHFSALCRLAALISLQTVLLFRTCFVQSCGGNKMPVKADSHTCICLRQSSCALLWRGNTLER